MHWATKYTGGAVVLSLFLFSLPVLRRHRHFAEKLKPALGFCLGSIVFILPWCLRNLFLRGNPIYPAALGGLPGDPYLYAFLRDGMPHSPWRYAAAAFDSLIFGSLVDGTGPLLWALIPPASYWALRNKKTAVLEALALGGISVMLGMLVFPGVPMTRFLAPGLSLACAAAFSFLEIIWDSTAFLFKWIVAASLVFPGVLFSLYVGGKRLPLWLGLESPRQFVKRHWSLQEDYSAYLFITRRIPQGSKILFTYQNIAPAYFYPHHQAVGLDIYPPDFYSADPGEALRVLKRDGIRYVLLAPGECRFDEDGTCINPLGIRLSWLNPKIFSHYAQLLFQGPRSSIYEIQK